MSLFKCKMCGGSLEVNTGESVVTCEYCGTQQTLPRLDDEKRANMYDRANHFRRNNEFDKAMAIYEQILNEDKTDAEAYWSIVLCRYGIEYVEDLSSHRRIPTINRAQYTSILADENYKSALANADTHQKSVYELEAKTIDEIQRGILSISSKEDPFDVFICYKEVDHNGRRTPDSVLAQDLYYGLKNEGFKVFFARITLEDKLGSAYEPYIFAALNSAKVMVVLGTRPEHFDAVWVKNEWSRYLALIKNGAKKTLIPAYRDMDPYDLPEEFSHLQAQDMSKLGFMQDLIRGIKKIADAGKKEPVKETVIVNQINQDHDISPMLKRAFLFLEDGDFDSADEYSEKVLDIDPECSDAYIVKLLIDLKLRYTSQISSFATPIDRNPNFVKALRFAKGDARAKIEGYNRAIVDRIELDYKKQQYAYACSLMNARKYDEAIAAFSKISTFKDSLDKIEACKQNKEIDRKEAIYANALRDVASTSADNWDIKKSITALESIKGYKDADTQIKKLQVRLEKWYEDRKAAEERARIKAEQDRLEAARQAELRKIRTEQNKKKAIKAAKIGVPCLLALVLVVILTVTLFVPMLRFHKADKLFAAGKYDEANRIYSELDGFRNSDKRISAITAIHQMEDKKLEDGIKTLLAAGIPVELTYQTEVGSLPETQTLMLGHTLSTDSSVVPLSAEEPAATASEQNVFTFTQVSDFTGLKTPTRNGYRFLKWSLDTYTYDVATKDAKFCLTLKATWSTKDYSVEYDLAGGSINQSNVAEYDPEDEAFTLINPTRVGYTFAGWTGTDLSKPTVNVTVPTGSYGDRTYTATWTANKYTVTYDAAGGTVSSKTQTVMYDANVEYLIPERTGYTFLGWYEGTVKHENETWTHTSDISLVARWEIVTYTIFYTLNGGSLSSTVTQYTVEDSVTIPNAQYSDANYEFLGWTYRDHTTPVKSLTIPKGTVGDIYLTANYDGVSTTITLDANGGTCETTSILTRYNETVTFPTPTRVGYTFQGWFIGTTEFTSGTWSLTSSVTLVAKWQVITYSISYSLDGGSVAGSNRNSYTVDDTFSLINPQKTGHTFLGWTYEGQSTPIKDVSVTNSTGHLSYTANWKANVYTITFDAGGGSLASTTMPVTYGKSFTLPTPTRKGGTFVGWFIGTTEYTSGTWNSTSNITLVARWDIAYYTVELNQNIEAAGTVSGGSTYAYGSDVTVTASSVFGYSFLGWYDDSGLCLTTDLSYSFTVEKNTTLTAKWKDRDFNFSITNDKIVLTGVKDKSKTSYDIPYGVTSIGSSAFYGCSSLTSITIPSSVTSIGSYAFRGCSSLTSITIPNGVTSIGEYAFAYCGLRSITIPNGVTSIGRSVFYDCDSLTSITIPNSVTSIGSNAFEGCSKLTSITIPNSITSIGRSVFYDCDSLTSITIPNSVTSIGTYAFWGCSSLTSITIPNSVTSIGEDAFSGCPITSVYITDMAKWCEIDFYDFYSNPLACSTFGYGTDLYLNGTLVTKLVIPNTVTRIGDYVFVDCDSLTSVTIPNSVTSIGNFAFDGCHNLTSITIPSSVMSIGEDAFRYCYSLTNITIPNSVTSIADGTFFGCYELTSVTIPNSVTSIGDYVFAECIALTNITIPNGVTSIGVCAFDGCPLESITIPNSVTSIGSNAFAWCYDLTTVNYTGTKEQWESITIEAGNTYLTNATINYNYPQQ